MRRRHRARVGRPAALLGLVVLAGLITLFGFLIAQPLYVIFFELMDYGYRNGVKDQWLGGR